MHDDETTPPPEVPAPEPHADLKRLDVMVGTWQLEGREEASGGAIQGRLVFEWMEGGFYLVQHVDVDYAGRRVRGTEYVGYQQSTGALRGCFFSNEGAGPFGDLAIEYVWEPDDGTVTIWGGDVGSPANFRGKLSPDRGTITGRWSWPGGGYDATMTRVADAGGASR